MHVQLVAKTSGFIDRDSHKSFELEPGLANVKLVHKDWTFVIPGTVPTICDRPVSNKPFSTRKTNLIFTVLKWLGPTQQQTSCSAWMFKP